LVIDEGAARGWVQNDSGQRQHINTRGKRVTSSWLGATEGNRYWFDDKGVMVFGKWARIEGKWYYFGAGGKLAVSTAIDGYAVGEGGNKQHIFPRGCIRQLSHESFS
jgi:glucan-binding YG repeat protein